MKTLMAAVVAAMTFGASAEMTIDLDLKAKPIKEMKSPEDGRAQRGGSETGYGDNKRTTARGAGQQAYDNKRKVGKWKGREGACGR